MNCPFISVATRAAYNRWVYEKKVVVIFWIAWLKSYLCSLIFKIVLVW